MSHLPDNTLYFCSGVVFQVPTWQYRFVGQICLRFCKQFYVGRIHPIEANQLVDIRQIDGESLKAYIQRFMQAASQAKTVGDEGRMIAITAGVRRQTPL